MPVCFFDSTSFLYIDHYPDMSSCHQNNNDGVLLTNDYITRLHILSQPPPPLPPPHNKQQMTMANDNGGLKTHLCLEPPGNFFLLGMFFSFFLFVFY